LVLRGAGGCLLKRANQRSVGEFDLEVVLSAAFGFREDIVGELPESRYRGRLSAQRFLRVPVAPRLVRYAAQSHPDVFDFSVRDLEGDCHGDECERIGLPVTNL
jgi:hypothetical protein